MPCEYDGNEAVPKYVFLSEWVRSWFEAVFLGSTTPTDVSPESSVREWLRRKLPRVTERLRQDHEHGLESVGWVCTTFENLCNNFLHQKDLRLDNAHSRDVVYRRLPPLLWKF